MTRERGHGGSFGAIPVALVALGLLAAPLGACGSDAEESASCPCAAGWVCCADRNVCARTIDSCPSASLEGGPGEEPTESGSEGDAAVTLPGAGEVGSDAGDAGADASGDDGAANVGSAGGTCITGRWCWMTPTPTGDDYTGLWASSATDAWMATSSGTIVHFDGVNLDARFQFPAPTFVATVWGRSANDVWFAFNEGDRTNATAQLVEWDGAQFNRYPFASSSSPITAMTGSPQSLLLAGPGGAIQRLAYTLQGSPPPAGEYQYPPAIVSTNVPTTSNLVDVWAADDSDVWVLDESANAYHGSVTNPNWTLVDPMVQKHRVAPIGLWGTGPHDAWVIQEEYGTTFGDAAMVFRHFDGASWTRTEKTCSQGGLNPAPPADHRHVWASGARDVWVIGQDLHCTWHWNGAEWSERSAPHSMASAIWSDGVQTLAAGAQGSVERWGPDDSWHDVEPAGPGGFTINGPQGVIAISAPADDDVYAIEDRSSVVHYDGASWQTLPPLTPGNSPPYDYPGSIYAAGRDDVWVTGFQTEYDSPNLLFIAHWNGTAWDEQAAADEPWTLWGRASNDVWAGGPSGAQRWDGKTWTKLPIQGCITAISGYGRDVWLAGQQSSSAGGGCAGDGVAWHWDGTALSPIPPWPAADGLLGFAPNDLWTWSVDGPSHWDGSKWTPMALPSGVTIRAAWGSRPDDVWFVGDVDRQGAAVYRWDGVALTQDVGGAIGSILWSITGTKKSLFVGGAGVLHGAR